MSDTDGFQGLQQERSGLREASKRLEEKRRSLEEKTRILEENARTEKLAIDKKLLVQILEEENRTHDAAVKELEDKIANMEKQPKSSPTIESTPSQTPSEIPEISDDVDDGVSVGSLQEPEQSEVEVPREGSKRKRRGLF